MKRKLIEGSAGEFHPHPHHIRPLANKLFDCLDWKIITRGSGLGYFGCLSDEIIIYLLKRFIWEKVFSLACVWFSYQSSLEIMALLSSYNFQSQSLFLKKLTNELQFSGFYSDVLYYSWYYSNVDMNEWTLHSSIERRSNLSIEEFEREYNSQNKPVILTDISQHWPCQQRWSIEKLTFHYKRKLAGVRKNKMNFDTFYTLMFHLSEVEAENALIFEDLASEASDVRFQSKIERPLSLSDYEVPKYFTEDIFQILGKTRPPFRWFLLGPARSGSCFHQDPNFTAAWNASIVGRKKFVLFPGDCVPPGVHQYSPDDFEPPHVVIQWFVEHYKSLKKGTFLECVVNPGEVIFVPSGWWHTVLNLDDTIAVTHNFADKYNIENIYDYTKSQKPELFKCLDDQLKIERPEIYEKINKRTQCPFGDDEAIPFFL